MGITKSEMVIKGSNNHNYHGLIFDVWNEMMGGEKELKGLENRVYYSLSACYSIVAVIALVQLVRIQMRVPEFGWTTQKIFHLMNILVNGLRAILFGLYKLVFLIRPHELEVILLDLPGLLFFSTYTLLVLFWAEIYHQARSLPTDTLRPIYYSVNGIVYFIQSCNSRHNLLRAIENRLKIIIIWLCMRIGRGHAALEAARLFFAVISFTAALGFLIYGGRLFIMLQRFPIESRGRQKKLYEVGCVTAICCTCFLVRCVVAAISAFDEDVDVDVMDHPIANLLYYMVVEIVPSGLVLFLLRKLPPKRVSDQYHAIE